MNFEFIGQVEPGFLKQKSLNPSEIYVIKDDDDDDDDDEVILIEDEGEKLDQPDNESSTVTESAAVNDSSIPVSVLQSSSDDDKYVCDICNKAFKSKGYCRTHRRKHNQSFMCNVCDYTCSQLNELIDHAKTHSTPKYACEECDFKCDCEKEMQRHKITHATSELFACIKCNFMCNNSWALQVHMHNVHKKPLQCEMCEFNCQNLRELKSHKRKHIDNVFGCDECIFTCHSSEELAAHNNSEHSIIIPDDNSIYDHSQQFTYRRMDLENDNDNDQCILPEICPAEEQSILPDSVNDLPDYVSNPDNNLPVITSVRSAAPVEPPQFFMNLPVNLGNQMIMLQNNQNVQTFSQNDPVYISDQSLIYGLNNNENLNQMYYIVQHPDYNSVQNLTNVNQNSNLYLTVSPSPACSPSHPKTNRTPKQIAPRPELVPPDNHVKRPRKSNVLQTFVIDKTDTNLSKVINSRSEPKKTHPIPLDDTVNEPLQKNGQPNFQYEFANFLQTQLPPC